MAAGTCSQPSLSPTQTMRNKAKSMLSLTAPSQMKRRASANLSHRTSYSSSNTSIGSAPPTPTSPTHPTGSGSTGSLSDSNGSTKPKKIRPGGGRRSYVGPSRSQVSLRPIPSMTTLPLSKPAPVQPAKQNVPKLKIKTGGGRRHMTVAKPPPAPPTLFPINVEAEVLDVRVMSPSPPASLPSRPSSPVPSSSSSSQQAAHAIPTPSTPSTRRIRIPPAPRIPPPPVPGSDPTLSPLSLSPLHSPARILHALPPSPSLSPSSPRRPFRALPSPPSPRGMPIPLSSSAPLPSAIRRLPSPPSSSLFSPLTPPSPLLLPLPLPQSFSPHQHELELLQSSSRSVYRNRRYSDVSEVETLPPYSVDPVSPPLSHSGSEHSSPSGYGSPQLVPIGHPIMRHGRNRHRRGSRNARSPNILPTQIEEQEDGLDQNGPLLHMKSSSVASDLLFYQENVMVPLFSGSPSSRPVHSRRRSSSTPPSSGASGSNTAPPHQTSLGDETLFLRRHIKPLDTKKANKEYKLPSNKPTEDDEDSDVDPAVCESPGYQGDSDRFERQMARYQDRKARYEESLQF